MIGAYESLRPINSCQNFGRNVARTVNCSHRHQQHRPHRLLALQPARAVSSAPSPAPLIHSPTPADHAATRARLQHSDTKKGNFVRHGPARCTRSRSTPPSACASGHVGVVTVRYGHSRSVINADRFIPRRPMDLTVHHRHRLSAAVAQLVARARQCRRRCPRPRPRSRLIRSRRCSGRTTAPWPTSCSRPRTTRPARSTSHSTRA